MYSRIVTDNNGDTVTIYVEDDVEDIIEQNKQLATLPQKSDWGRHVASIPNVILNRWLNEEQLRGNWMLRMGGEEWDKLVARKLQDPDWRFLRVDK